MRVSDIDIDVINTAHIWDKEKRNFSLAVVVKTWGSSPRQVGSMMLIRDDGHIVGSVSGGCVEGSVIFSAKKILAESSAEILDFGVADQDAWSVGLSCGGKISVFVCPRKKIQAKLFFFLSFNESARPTPSGMLFPTIADVPINPFSLSIRCIEPPLPPEQPVFFP